MAAKPRKKVTKKAALPAPLPVGFTVDDIFKNKWMIGEKIGSGGCGVVYLAREAGSRAEDYEYVMKVEFHGNGPLYTEIHFYQNIAKPEQIQQWLSKKKLRHLGMSACHGLGSFEHNGIKCRFLVLQRYGTDLQQYLDEYHTFNAKTAYTVALAVVDVLEYLHGCNYVHGDVKAANLLRGRKRGTENNIYLVDMGLATKYMTSATGHRKEAPDPKKAHNGTIEYTSRDSHRGTPCTRRSDFETLAYNLLMWLSGSLPWVGVTDVKKVAELKEKSMSDVKKFAKEMFGSKVPPGIVEYLMFVQNLGFEEVPDYEAVRKILVNGIKSSKSKVDGVLSFGSAQKSKPSGSASEEPKSFSSKENVKEKAAAKPSTRPKRKRELTPVTLEPGIKPTPAMLEIMNKRKS